MFYLELLKQYGINLSSVGKEIWFGMDVQEILILILNQDILMHDRT